MSDIVSQTLTDAPGSVVFPFRDNTLTSSVSSALVPACVVVATKGAFGKVLDVTNQNLKAVLGDMLSPLTSHYEGLRQLKEAVAGTGSAKVVRVIPTDAKVPVTNVNKDKSSLLNQLTITPGTKPTMPANHWGTFWPKDGDAAKDWTVKLFNPNKANAPGYDPALDVVDGELIIAISKGSTWQPFWQAICSLDPNAKDDDGGSIYLPNVLEKAAYLDVLLSGTAAADASPLLDDHSVSFDFKDGDSGSTITAKEFSDAWELLGGPNQAWTHAFTAGMYETTAIRTMVEKARMRLAPFKIDVPPTMNETQAAAWVKSLNITDAGGQAFHYPYKTDDSDFGGKTIVGISGATIAMKANCYRQPTSSGIPGAHLALAGKNRGVVPRSGAEPLFDTGHLSKEDRVKARFNSTKNGLSVNDVLTLSPKRTYMRFEHVNEVMVVMARELLAALEDLEFEPDEDVISTLQSLGAGIQKRYEDGGAAVTPRDPKSGTAPITFEFEQKEIDLWMVNVGYSPVGVARRFGLQLGLMR